MAKCYLMIEDTDDGGVNWGADFGLPEGEELPENVDDLTDAQYTLHQFLTALRQIGDAALQQEIREEQQETAGSGLIVPAPGIIR